MPYWLITPLRPAPIIETFLRRFFGILPKKIWTTLFKLSVGTKADLYGYRVSRFLASAPRGREPGAMIAFLGTSRVSEQR